MGAIAPFFVEKKRFLTFDCINLKGITEYWIFLISSSLIFSQARLDRFIPDTPRNPSIARSIHYTKTIEIIVGLFVLSLTTFP